MNDILRNKQIIDYFALKERIFQVVQQHWTEIEEGVQVLKIFYVTTKALQRVDFTLSDFYGYLIVLKENIKQFLQNAEQQTNLATCLQSELINRMPMLMKNPMMICAVFLDRRYSSELNPDEKVFAIRTLIKIWEQIRSDEIKMNENSEMDGDIEFKFPDNASVLEQYFSSKGVDLEDKNETINGRANFSINNARMYDILEQFDKNVGRQHATKGVLEYWEEKKAIFPEIYLLSTVINAIPPTQATTERCFSSLNFIYDEKRTRLSLTLLEQILLIRLNKDMVFDIFEEDLNLIAKKKP